MKLHSILLAFGLVASSAVHAQFGNPLKTELRVFKESIAAQCASVKEQAAVPVVNPDPLMAFTLKDAVQSLCVCMPAQTEAMIATLTPEELAGSVTEVEFMSLLKPHAFDKCTAEQMKSMYGEQCVERFRNADVDVHMYCACMHKTVSGYSNAVTAAIASAASDFIPRAAEAEKNGEPMPPRPTILQAYFEADQACKGISVDQLREAMIHDTHRFAIRRLRQLSYFRD